MYVDTYVYIYVILICDIWIDYNDVSATLQSMNFRIGAIIPFFFAYYFRLAFDIIQIHAGHSLKHCVFAYMASELYRRRSKVTSSKQNWKYLLNDQICIYIYICIYIIIYIICIYIYVYIIIYHMGLFTNKYWQPRSYFKHFFNLCLVWGTFEGYPRSTMVLLWNIGTSET
jgi:hypothetical protein